ncbi:hypothetical protein PIB30_089184 [Stylosanthes scabra]|uniref:FAR1 domain-containing protein n=1 Tax=Stylosanthes scabra TaxID=79078 RepID=A0ABU6TTD6_9FABA|nr:hypothetical protein [Stylosanthes scabra]
MGVQATGGTGNCQYAGCVSDLNDNCPMELQVKDVTGLVVACKSMCAAFNTEEYCCIGEHATPQTCPPTNYSKMFKGACPRAYSYAYDDASSTWGWEWLGYGQALWLVLISWAEALAGRGNMRAWLMAASLLCDVLLGSSSSSLSSFSFCISQFATGCARMEASSSDPSVELSSDHSCESNNTEEFSCDVDEQYVLKVGMLFQSLEEARNFYRDYAKLAGFAIRIRNTNKSNKSNEILNQLLSCNREGKRRSDVPVSEKTNAVYAANCPARVHVHHLKIIGLWEISKVVLGHSHACCPNHASMFPQY